jgi:hypothetical protein
VILHHANITVAVAMNVIRAGDKVVLHDPDGLGVSLELGLH